MTLLVAVGAVLLLVGLLAAAALWNASRGAAGELRRLEHDDRRAELVDELLEPRRRWRR